MARVIGLTGGIASGKSTVSAMLKDLGALIIDADKIARRIVEKGRPALDEIKEHFGEEVILENGELNRKKMANLVFNDKLLLDKLNQITHPYINKEIIDDINWYKKTLPNHVIILDAPLLIESKLTYLVDEVWLVFVPEDIQLTRLMNRDQLSLDEAKKRIAAQMPLEEKKGYADKILDNSKDINYLREQVEANWSKLVK